MTEAAVMLVERLMHEQTSATAPATKEASAVPHRPIWEVAADLRKSVPEEEWAKLPVDGAAQHDHSIYHTPKRPAK
jgi:hypothetical protein